MFSGMGLILAMGMASVFGEPLERSYPQVAQALGETAAAPRSQMGLPPAEKSPWKLRVLTYNIHGIFPMTQDSARQPDAMAMDRFREIARRLRRLREEGRAPHIVVIQEAFNPWAAKAATEAGYPFALNGASARLGKVVGSGLILLSEFPIFSSETADYANCAGWDCLANKGALHARIVVPELMQAFDIYTTHMNADGPPAKLEDSRKARMAQIKDFAEFVRHTRDSELPAVLAGDFNCKPPWEDYALFERLVGGANAAEECLYRGDCSGDEPGQIWRGSIDHQFHLPGLQGTLQPSHLARTFKEPHNGKPLSDHMGLEAHYLFLFQRSRANGAGLSRRNRQNNREGGAKIRAGGNDF